MILKVFWMPHGRGQGFSFFSVNAKNNGLCCLCLCGRTSLGVERWAGGQRYGPLQKFVTRDVISRFTNLTPRPFHSHRSSIMLRLCSGSRFRLDRVSIILFLFCLQRCMNDIVERYGSIEETNDNVSIRCLRESLALSPPSPEDRCDDEESQFALLSQR